VVFRECNLRNTKKSRLLRKKYGKMLAMTIHNGGYCEKKNERK